MAFHLQKFAQMPAHSKIKEWTFSKHATRLKDSQTSHIFKRKLIFKKMKMNDISFEYNIRMRQHWTGNIQYWHHPTVQQRTVPGNKEPECPPTCRWRGTCPTPPSDIGWVEWEIIGSLWLTLCPLAAKHPIIALLLLRRGHHLVLILSSATECFDCIVTKKGERLNII